MALYYSQNSAIEFALDHNQCARESGVGLNVMFDFTEHGGKFDFTPLHFAVSQNNFHLLFMLINSQEPIDHLAVDSQGRRAIDLCSSISTVFKALRREIQKQTWTMMKRQGVLISKNDELRMVGKVPIEHNLIRSRFLLKEHINLAQNQLPPGPKQNFSRKQIGGRNNSVQQERPSLSLKDIQTKEQDHSLIKAEKVMKQKSKVDIKRSQVSKIVKQNLNNLQLAGNETDKKLSHSVKMTRISLPSKDQFGSDSQQPQIQIGIRSLSQRKLSAGNKIEDFNPSILVGDRRETDLKSVTQITREVNLNRLFNRQWGDQVLARQTNQAEYQKGDVQDVKASVFIQDYVEGSADDGLVLSEKSNFTKRIIHRNIIRRSFSCSSSNLSDPHDSEQIENVSSDFSLNSELQENGQAQFVKAQNSSVELQSLGISEKKGIQIQDSLQLVDYLLGVERNENQRDSALERIRLIDNIQLCLQGHLISQSHSKASSFQGGFIKQDEEIQRISSAAETEKKDDLKAISSFALKKVREKNYDIEVSSEEEQKVNCKRVQQQVIRMRSNKPNAKIGMHQLESQEDFPEMTLEEDERGIDPIHNSQIFVNQNQTPLNIKHPSLPCGRRSPTVQSSPDYPDLAFNIEEDISRNDPVNIFKVQFRPALKTQVIQPTIIKPPILTSELLTALLHLLSLLHDDLTKDEETKTRKLILLILDYLSSFQNNQKIPKLIISSLSELGLDLKISNKRVSKVQFRRELVELSAYVGSEEECSENDLREIFKMVHSELNSLLLLL